MTEQLVIELGDGTKIEPFVSVESGDLHIALGGFLGVTIIVKRESARRCIKCLAQLMGVHSCSLDSRQ